MLERSFQYLLLHETREIFDLPLHLCRARRMCHLVKFMNQPLMLCLMLQMQ
jgi:hypothetical protein